MPEKRLRRKPGPKPRGLKPYTTRLPIDLLDDYRAASLAAGVTMSSAIEVAMRRYLPRLEMLRRRRTQE